MTDRVFLFEEANHQLKDIAAYTLHRWGEAKAREYITEIYTAFESWVDQPGLWRSVEVPGRGEVHYMKTGRHVAFFVPLKRGRIGIAAIYHDRMDFMERLESALAFVDDSH